MRSAGRRRDWEQREKRERRGENIHLFDATLVDYYGTIPREQWEGVIAVCSGNVARAAVYCGLTEVKEGARALWGTSKEDALSVYHAWQQAKTTGQKPPPREKKPARARGPRSRPPPRR